MKKIKCSLPIAIFAFVALVCRVLSCTTYFFRYQYIPIEDGNSYYELTFVFPGLIDVLFLLLGLAPCILFLLYILKFHRQYKGAVVYPIACGLIAVPPLLSVIRNALGTYGFYLPDALISLAIIVPFTLLTVNATKGLNKKVYTIVATSFGLVIQLLSAISIISIMDYYFDSKSYLYLLTTPMSIIGTAALYIALLLFGVNNRIPVLVPMSPEKERQKVEKMSPDQSLRFLRDKLELGMITEEEYQVQRAEILSKL